MLLKIRDVSEYLHVKESWIKYRVFKKQIPFVKVGRHIRFDLEAIKKWVAQNSFANEVLHE